MHPKNVIRSLAAFVTALFAFGPIAAAQDNTKNETDLIAVLRSDAPAAEKAITCKRLAVYGSSAAVPELAPLLANEQLASWARIALEAIPGPASDEALRKAAESLQGRLLVGTINSIGFRRDAGAVDLLVARLGDAEVDVVSAAAVALGHIGNETAAKALRKALAGEPVKARSAVAEGCVLCAERSWQEGKNAEAVAIYDEVRKADVPLQRMLEATRGAILARQQDGLPLLVETLRSPLKGVFQLGLSTAREFPGSEVDKALAAEVDRATPERAAALIVAMADREDTVVLSAVLKAARNGPQEVRLAAVSALGRVGNVTCLPPLLEIAVEANDELVQAAKTALADLPGETVNREIVELLSKAQGKTYPLLIEVVGQRRIEATDALVKALDHSDKAVRAAALTSLGATVPPQRLSVLIAQVVAPKRADEAEAAQQALKTAAVRMPDREACAAELAAALDRAPAAAKTPVLETLGAVGGAKALQTIGATAKSNDPNLQNVSTRLLGEWMTLDAAPVLLDLAKTGPGQFQVRSLRGYIRMARQLAPTEAQRAEMCRIAFETARQPAEQKLVLEVIKLRREPNLDMLKLAVDAVKMPELKEDAAAAAQEIAKKLGNKPEVRELMSQAGLGK